MSNQYLQQLIEKRCWLPGTFTLRSGKTSNQYFDKYLMESDPALLNKVCEELNCLIPSDTEILAGIELGGIPLATAISLKRSLPQVFVRKNRKAYGTCQRVEGCNIQGIKVTLIEDVISTGGAVLRAMEALQEEGAYINAIVCVLKRDATLENIAGIPVYSVF